MAKAAATKKKAASKKAAEKKPVGRPKNIETPEIMWQLFQQYAKETKSKPLIVKDWVGGIAKEVYREKERPLTLEGFEIFVMDKLDMSDLDQYFANREGRYTNFVSVCSRIRKNIREDQIAGGMAGIYNPSITQRLNGLTEKIQEDGNKEVTIKVKYEKKETPKD
jgi:hypothetical protein